MRRRNPERRSLPERRHGRASLVGGRLYIEVPDSVRDEIADLLATRFGLEPDDFTIVDLEYILGHQMSDFLASERLLRYIDRDASAGVYDTLVGARRRR